MPLLKRFGKNNVLIQIQYFFLMPSQHLIRNILFLVVLFSFQSSIFAAKDAFSLYLNLNECENNSLHIVMRTPSIELRKVRFVIPSNIPGTISELKTGKLFSNIRAYNTANEVLTVEPYSMNEYEIIIHGQLARIEYDVHDSWHFQNGNLILPQIGTSFKPGTQFLLNFHALAGYIQGFEDFPFHVEIKKPHQLYTISGLDITMNDSIDIAEAEQGYLELIDNPILYSKEKERTFIVGKTKFKIGYYTEGVDNQSLTIEKVLKSVCESANAYCEGFTEKQYTFILNYVLPESDPFKAEEAFGAVEHSKSAVFYFPITNNMYKFERDLSYTCAHELMHLFGPLKMQTDVTSKINFRAKSQSENLWMYEGFTEYLSLQMLYQQELITETEFINEIRNKINLVNYTENYALSDASKTCYLEGNENMYKSFYTKGALIAMMMDLKLMKLSKGKMSLKSLLIDLQSASRENYVMRDEQMTDELAKYSYPEIKDFLQKYVRDTISLNYNEYLSSIGWKYETQKTDTSKMYVSAVYRYSKSTKEYFLANISIDQVGFREGDVLLAINKKKVTKENLNSLIDKYSATNYNKQVTFLVRRNNKEVELSGPPILVTKNQKNMIVVEKKIEYEKNDLRKVFSGSGGSRNQAFRILN